MATAKTVDMTNVKDGGGNFNKRRVLAGDYPARITKVVDAKAKGDGEFQWLFTIETETGGTYPYYCKLQENQLWKIRNLCLAAGMSVPKKKLKLDPEKLVGKRIAVTLEDDEYDGKKQSVVQATFPLSELTSSGGTADDADDDDEEEEDAEDDEDEEEAAPADEYSNMDRNALKKVLKVLDDSFVVKKSMSDDDLRAQARKLEAELSSDDDDDEDEDEEPAPPPKKKAAKKTAKAKKKTAEVEDDELEELDLDDI